MIANESEERRLLSEWQARAEKAEARVAELTSMVEQFVKCMFPNPMEHPTMHAAWIKGKAMLAGGADSVPGDGSTLREALGRAERRELEALAELDEYRAVLKWIAEESDVDPNSEVGRRAKAVLTGSTTPSVSTGLDALRAALKKATDDGTLDALNGELHPNIINAFCDAVMGAPETGSETR